MTANDASAGELAAVPPLPGAIDVHAHFITDRLRAAMQAAGHGEPDGMPAIPDWDPEAALTHMDAVGVRTAMLSVSSPGVDFGDAGATRELARSVNDEGAELVRAHPGRFGLMASLPLPDIPAALAEAEYALDRLGADGIVLKTHYQGRYLGDPHYEPLMDLLDERRAVVCLHPTSPQCWQDTSLGYPRPMVEFAFDTTRTVAHLIMSGTLRRHPGISFIVPHAGAARGKRERRPLVAVTTTPHGQHVVWAGPLGYREPALHGHIWTIVEHYRISAMSAVPTVYSVLAQVPVNADISSLRFAVVGASALPDAVRTAFTRHTGVEICEGYGLTEATCATARSFTGDDHRPGSVGQRLPYQQVKTALVDPQGNWLDLPPGSPGVLLVKGPTVFAGYVTGHDPDGVRLDSLETIRDGWLNTGDLARVDKDGFSHLLGRAKDLIIRGAHNIDPGAIEDALLHHPHVTGASAVGRPDPQAGEVPVVYVTLAPDAPKALTGPDALIAHARAFLHESAAVPKDVIVLDALPVTAVGKPTKVPLRMRTLKRTVLDELAAADLPSDPNSVGCHLDGARLTVTLPRPASSADADRITAALGRYTFDWTFTQV
ncbi:long-chain-fatty-acid--CoA ligase [Streptomyces sp. L-9-10]|uniref:AMP-binding protein n=1 Tax=Streptomyces sp. L-9-10 TaxID=1478131 RepID=UPI0010E23313|nr:AMP-binding protein [Streptomyces sp. L-9-10]RYJ25773.1 long-chain-fatty-acid--CoA ligase [Streptomyces sp. L-9-10]